MSKLKEPPFVNINPNGRVPAIQDPKTGITLWESGAIIQYLVNEYDKDHKISYGKSPEMYHEIKWLSFQVCALKCLCTRDLHRPQNFLAAAYPLSYGLQPFDRHPLRPARN